MADVFNFAKDAPYDKKSKSVVKIELSRSLNTRKENQEKVMGLILPSIGWSRFHPVERVTGVPMPEGRVVTVPSPQARALEGFDKFETNDVDVTGPRGVPNHLDAESPLEARESAGSLGTDFEYPVPTSDAGSSNAEGDSGRGRGDSDAVEELRRAVGECRNREGFAINQLNSVNNQLRQANTEKGILIRRLSDVSFLGIRLIQGNPMPAFGRIYQFIDEALLGIYEATARVRSNEGDAALVALETAVARLDGCFSFLRRMEVVSRLFVGGGAERERLIRVLLGNLPARVAVPSFNTMLERTRLSFPVTRPLRAPILPPVPPNSPVAPSSIPQAIPTPASNPTYAHQNALGNGNTRGQKRASETLEEGEIPNKRVK
ncbi:hypothetical protein K435DRAFT_805363 [Dendrothele bispora CBS 962.96]|uniref:Uncharacterized protein n=1 Tax=Dendrothele bispora (strain CBS 962.96) TaxID=1314807 RepID=A0A4S8LB84_DENBC|nr:hypothetical protein K435DRAFT_805363 [Dendrothele bispora CBS 962.96]